MHPYVQSVHVDCGTISRLVPMIGHPEVRSNAGLSPPPVPMCLTTRSPGISWEKVSELFARDDVAEVGFVRLRGLFQFEAVSVAAVEPVGASQRTGVRAATSP